MLELHDELRAQDIETTKLVEDADAEGTLVGAKVQHTAPGREHRFPLLDTGGRVERIVDRVFVRHVYFFERADVPGFGVVPPTESLLASVWVFRIYSK